MQHKSIVVALLVVSAALPAAGCRSSSVVPSLPASPATADPADSDIHSPGADEPGDEYWTPERMESAVPAMPTEG